MPVHRVIIVQDRPNHLLHLILSLLTGGLWIPVWFVLVCKFRVARLARW